MGVRNSRSRPAPIGREARPGEPPAETVELSIERLAGGGRGVGRSDGVVWFVEHAFPGDVVLAEPQHRRPRFVEARRLRLVHPSPLRRSEPPCALAGRCGGCPWIELDLAAQQRAKREIVADAIARIGRFQGFEVAPLVSAPHELGYRDRVELTLGRDVEGRRVMGFHGLEASHRIVDVARCPVLAEPGNRVLEAIRAVALPALADAAFDASEPVRLVVRVSPVDGGAVVAFRESAPLLDDLRPLAVELMRREPTIRGVVRLVAHAGRRGGQRSEIVAGTASLAQRIGAAVVHVPVGSFSQVNVELAGLMTEHVADAAGMIGGATVVDLYCGAGRHGLELVARGARVEAADADPHAVAAANDAAHAAGLAERFHAHASDAAAFLRSRARSGAGPVAALVANPPRSGLERAVSEAIAALAPPRVVIVSCDPATLARDLRRLADAGYRLESVVPFDLFPQTAHVEAVAALDRVTTAD
jgi:23S rRNA (uracil1939-C5)-methyltransferase